MKVGPCTGVTTHRVADGKHYGVVGNNNPRPATDTPLQSPMRSLLKQSCTEPVLDPHAPTTETVLYCASPAEKSSR